MQIKHCSLRRKLGLMPLVLLFICLGIRNTTFGQTLTAQEHLELAKLVCEIKELEKVLLHYAPEGQRAIYVNLNTKFFNEEWIDSSATYPLCVWHLKTLFFHGIAYWLYPVSIEKKSNQIVYHYRTCSLMEDKAKTYYKGEVRFKKSNGNWVISAHRMHEVPYACSNYGN